MTLFSKLLLSFTLTLYFTSAFSAQDLWDKTKNAVTNTASKVTDTATNVVSDKPSPEQAKKQINASSKKTLSRLFNESKQAKNIFDKSAGYAVFDSREFAFMIKTGFGSGVAVHKASNSRTYMKMASGGVNIGGGVKYLQVVFLFPNDKTFNNFINNGWNAEGDASAVGGDDSAKVGITLSDGTQIYELTDTGLMLKMSISGTKYWKNSDLN